MAVNASVLIAREGNTTVMKMSHVPKYFSVVYVYTVRFACIPDLSYTSWVTKVSVHIDIIIIFRTVAFAAMSCVQVRDSILFPASHCARGIGPVP